MVSRNKDSAMGKGKFFSNDGVVHPLECIGNEDRRDFYRLLVGLHRGNEHPDKGKYGRKCCKAEQQIGKTQAFLLYQHSILLLGVVDPTFLQAKLHGCHQ